MENEHQFFQPIGSGRQPTGDGWRRVSSSAVRAYVFALLQFLPAFVLAYLRGTGLSLSATRTISPFLYAAPILVVILGVIALKSILRDRMKPLGRSYAIAAIVTGIVGIPATALQVSMINGFEPRMYMANCQNNLKQIGTAMQLYAADYNDRLPSSYLYGRSRTWNPHHFEQFASRIGKLPAAPSSTRMTWPMLLCPYQTNTDIHRCPSDPQWTFGPNDRTSYYWKAAIDRAWYGGFRTLDAFAYQSDQILAYEHNAWHFGDESMGLADKAQINCVFLDTHVETVVIRQSGYTKSENPPGPLPRSGVGEPAWFNRSMDDHLSIYNPNKGINWNPQKWADSF